MGRYYLGVHALGAAELEYRIDFFGEGCLSGEVALHLGASSRAILFGAEAEGPVGTRTGKNGFGHFCRNKSASSAGAKPCI